MFYKLCTIAKNTFIETLRQPIYAVIIVSSLLLLLVSPSLTMYTLDEDIKMLREIGLSTLFISGLFIAIFASASAITEEIESKTITTVLSKPITRSTFILGKFLGVTTAVLLAHYILTVTLIMTLRHGVMTTANDTHDWTVITAATAAVLLSLFVTAFLNYTYDWVFNSTAMILGAIFATFAMLFIALVNKEWQFNPAENAIESFDIYASILLFFAITVLVALAVMFSTRFNVVMTLTCSIVVFLLGLISDYIFGRLADQHLWAKIGYAIVPDMQAFWISDAIYESSSIPLAYLGTTAIYAALYTAGIISIAIALFQKRQVG